jgi:hypothetical protein
MITKNEFDIYASSISDIAKSLRNLAEKDTLQGSRIIKVSSKLDMIGCEVKTLKETWNFAEHRIIPFQRLRMSVCNYADCNVREFTNVVPIQALPGVSLPKNIPDCRPMLQRDGLILLGWDIRSTETGERYTAYWVTSVGVARFYASKTLHLNDLSSARPDHKSYAAEDGIEFYGQEAPSCLVHVAPELMMSNPRHKELRLVHINKLKCMGSKVNFNYKYLLKTEKNHAAIEGESHDGSKDRAS